MACFISATVEFEGDNLLLAEAETIGRTAEKKDEEPRPAEPAEGSFENFMSTFGNPARWAGSN